MVPVWSFSLLAFVPFLRLALVRRQRRDWMVFAGYLAVVMLEIILLSLPGPNDVAGTIAFCTAVALIGTAASLGLTPQEAAAVIATRDQLGRFTSAEELSAYAELPPTGSIPYATGCCSADTRLMCTDAVPMEVSLMSSHKRRRQVSFLSGCARWLGLDRNPLRRRTGQIVPNHRGQRSQRWPDLPPQRKAAIVAAAAVQFGLAGAAWADLARRPASGVRGPKWRWALLIAVNYAGPAAYFVWGRRPRRKLAT
jgi:hypothetical protein